MFFFKKKENKISDFFSNSFVDIHSHLLPGLDDGASDLDESIQLIKKMSDLGIKNFITTPHVLGDIYQNSSTAIKEKLQKVKDELLKRNITDVSIDVAAEYMLDEQFSLLLEKNDILTLKRNNAINTALLDGVLIKKANKQEQFTEEQIQDLQKCMDPDTGYLYFAKKFAYIQHPVKGKLLFEPFDYQLGLMHSYHNYRFNINMMPRQTGKTTCASIYLAWYAMFVPDQTCLIAAHKYTGAQEIMSRIRFVYESCPDHIRAGVTSYNKGSIEFENGSRIVSQTTTGNTGRGMSISLLYCDEFAFVQPNIAEEFWTSISPTLATGGRAIITSTPNQDDDQFAQIYREADKAQDEFGNDTATGLGLNGFRAFNADWKYHPDRDEEWASEERNKIGEERFRREHLNEFIAFDETLIDSIKLSLMETKQPFAKLLQ